MQNGKDLVAEESFSEERSIYSCLCDLIDRYIAEAEAGDEE